MLLYDGLLNKPRSRPARLTSRRRLKDGCNRTARFKSDDVSAVLFHWVRVTQNVIRDVIQNVKMTPKKCLRIVLQIAFSTNATKAFGMKTKQSKLSISARVHSVIKELIRVERGGLSDGEFIETLVAQNVKTEKGRRILTEWAASDPLVCAVAESLPKNVLVGSN